MLTNKKAHHHKVVSNGIEYYSVIGLNVLQKEMLRLLKIINEIANENNINYWIDSGSLIGVLRHDGFIPWDDDLDISMLKEDYLRMVQLLTEYSHHHDDGFLFFESPQCNHTCNYFASRTVFSRSNGSITLIPAKVDIRPLNSIVDNEQSIIENNVLRDTANTILFGKNYGYAKKIPLSKTEITHFFKNYNNNYGLCDASNDNTLLVHPYFEFSSQFKLKYSDIFPVSYHVFDDIIVPIPRNYHYLLTQLYGEYMNLPSIEHRAPVACKVYQKNISNLLYKKYIHNLFGFKVLSLKQRIEINILCLRVLGIREYFKAKFLEFKW